MLNAIIVDDERIVLNELVMYIEKSDIHIVGAYQDPRIALNTVKTNEVDIAFLDIEMPEINGIELAKKFKFINPQIHIVFITAYTQYAINAFGINAIHYLLKPIKQQDIKDAIERVVNLKKMTTELGNIKSASLIQDKSGVPDRISVQDNNDIIVIQLTEILYLSSNNGITTIFTKTGSYTTRKSMQFWDESLSSLDFIRCHKSYIVNAKYISKMLHVLGEYKELLLNYCDVKITISRRKFNDVKKWLGML